MKKLPILVGTALVFGFSYANAQTHVYTHDGYGRAGLYPSRPAPAAVRVVPAVAVVHDAQPSYGHGTALREAHRQPRHGIEHGRREPERRRHNAAHGSRGH